MKESVVLAMAIRETIQIAALLAVLVAVEDVVGIRYDTLPMKLLALLRKYAGSRLAASGAGCFAFFTG